MSQNAEATQSKRARRRGKWKENWIRQYSEDLAKKQKLMDNAAGDVIKCPPPAVVGLLPKPQVDKVVLSPKRKGKFSNPLHMWRKTYENLLKWQTTHQLNYWKNNSRYLQTENSKLKDNFYKLRRTPTIAKRNKNTRVDDEVIDLENEESPLESSSGSEHVCVVPTENEKKLKFMRFLKATAAYNRKKK